MVPQICGIMMSKKMRKSLAPSMRAASSVSSGMPRSAADRITMAKPVWIQIRITISRNEFQDRDREPRLRLEAEADGNRVQHADLLDIGPAIGVDELPDHRARRRTRSPSA